jgi:salicylate synthetase
VTISAFEQWAARVPAPHRTSLPPVPADRLAAAVNLATAGTAQPYLLYEAGDTVTVALGAAAQLRLSAAGLRLETADRTWTVPLPDQPLAAVSEAVRALAELAGDEAARRLYGWALFELAHLLHGTAGNARIDGDLLHLIVPETEVLLSPGETVVTATDPRSAGYVRVLLDEPAPTARIDHSAPELTALVEHDADGYRGAVAEIVAQITEGRLGKAVPSRVVPLDDVPPVDLPATYLSARAANTPARSFLLDLGGWHAAGLSPETVLEARPDGRITTQPLAGTRALGPDAARNDVLRAELLADPKEVHEHAISVKLACTELERVCAPGSVAVEEFMTVRERGSVQHLASRVSGRLDGRADAWTALSVLFPAITATGVPKHEALTALLEHEGGPRGLYGGAVIAADTAGALDAALVLRTIFRRGGRTWLRAGAGVVLGSNPDREFAETCEKLHSLVPHLRLAQAPANAAVGADRGCPAGRG